MSKCAVSCFLGGLGVGLIASVLVAPQSGEETRKAISRKAAEGRDYISSQRENMHRRAADVKAAGQAVSDLANAGKDFVT